MRRSVRRNIGYVISLSLFVVAMIVLHHELRRYHYRDIVAELKQVRPALLALAASLTALDYLVLVGYDALALRYIRHRLEWSKIALASFIGYVFSHNMTIVGGSTARYRIYSALGVSASEVARLVAFCGLTFWLGFFAISGSVFLLRTQAIPDALDIPFVSARPLGVIFLVPVLAYLLGTAFRRRPISLRGWEFSIPSVPISVGQIGLASVDWLMGCGVLYVLLPAEAKISFVDFLGIFMLAQVVGLLSYVPGGLGVFETVTLLLLSDKADESAIVSSLVLYRLIYYLLPLGLAAGLLAAHELASKKRALKELGVTLGKWSSAVTPHVLAAASFVAGAILLLSGALPEAKGRMEWLNDLLPLPAIELSHFLGSLAGAGLLILARGLQRRVDAAYHLTVILLGLGAVFSLLKGFDYEQAIILAVMLLLFLPCIGEFRRKASLVEGRFTPAWIASIVAVLIASVWLGFFSYKHVEYSDQLWWRFAIHGDAPRFLRATLGASVLVLLYGLAWLMVPTSPKAATAEAATMHIVAGVVARSRKTYANLALLGDKTFLISNSSRSFIMYAVEGRSWIAMGDPVGPEEEWEELLWTFRELCDRHDGWPVFYQVGGEHLDSYVDLGMTFLKLGEEGRVNLADFSLEGPSARDLRYARRKVERENCAFAVVPAADVPGLLDTLRTVSDAWLSEKNTKEKRFSMGLFDPEYLGRFPAAIVRRADEIIAFANIWPGAEKQELSIDLMRYLPSAPNGIMDYLFAELMLWGKEQGYVWFSLGMAPMSGLEDRSLAPIWHKLGTFVFRHGEHFYNFQGLRQYKEKFGPQWQPRYLACPRGLMLPRILTNLATLISGGVKGVVAKQI
jgi:phosphatidylglycerol lysyltransferase